jgi:hypothetical protein
VGPRGGVRARAARRGVACGAMLVVGIRYAVGLVYGVVGRWYGGLYGGLYGVYMGVYMGVRGGLFVRCAGGVVSMVPLMYLLSYARARALYRGGT